MKQEKTIQMSLSDVVTKQLAVVANQEGRKLDEMARILLEDGLALRETVRASNCDLVSEAEL